jgi:hypothetical protein
MSELLTPIHLKVVAIVASRSLHKIRQSRVFLPI